MCEQELMVSFVTHWGTSEGCPIVETHKVDDCSDYGNPDAQQPAE